MDAEARGAALVGDARGLALVGDAVVEVALARVRHAHVVEGEGLEDPHAAGAGVVEGALEHRLRELEHADVVQHRAGVEAAARGEDHVARALGGVDELGPGVDGLGHLVGVEEREEAGVEGAEGGVERARVACAASTASSAAWSAGPGMPRSMRPRTRAARSAARIGSERPENCGPRAHAARASPSRLWPDSIIAAAMRRCASPHMSEPGGASCAASSPALMAVGEAAHEGRDLGLGDEELGAHAALGAAGEAAIGELERGLELGAVGVGLARGAGVERRRRAGDRRRRRRGGR